jgi:hypothetical protein
MSLSNGTRVVLIQIVSPGVARMLDTASPKTVELPLSAALECVDRLLASGYTVAG